MKACHLNASTNASYYKKVAAHFSKAATQYEMAAQLQCKVGKELLSFLRTEFYPEKILDLGCSTAYLASELKTLYPYASLLGLDISLAMLRKATSKKSVELICANMEQLPLENQSLDLVFANMSLQWSSQLDHNFTEIKRVLTPQGKLLFSVPGPKTLIELKQSWQAVDHFTHVNSFPSQLSLQQHLRAASFKKINLKQKFYVLEYPSVVALMQHLKNTGADCVLQQQNGLMGKTKFKQMVARYELFRKSNALLPCTYEIIFGEASA